MKKLPSYIWLVFWFGCQTGIAQLEHNGVPVSWGLSNQPEMGYAWQVLPEIDQQSLIMEDEAQMEDKSKPYRFAYAHPTDFTLQNSGGWTNLLNGDRIWILGIEFPEVLSIALTLRNIEIPRGGRIYFYNEDHSRYIGALTSRDNTSGFMGLPHIEGSKIIIEYYEPYAYRGDGSFRIDHVAGAYRSPYSESVLSGQTCYQQVNAQNSLAGTARVASSVMMMMVDYGQKMCTSTILNNSRVDAMPYALTASSCLIGPASSWVFYFDINKFRCQDFFSCELRTLSGASIVRNDSDQGISLLRLLQAPLSGWDTFYSGWVVDGDEPDAELVCLHHAGASNLAVTRYSHFWTVSSTNGRDLVHLEMNSSGKTFQGSLGAPLFDGDWNLIGVFVGGNDACDTPGSDEFALLSESWSSLRSFLDPLQIVQDRIPGYYPEVSFESGQSVSEEISFFPNPAKDWIYVRNDSESRILEVNLMNAVGQVIQRFQPDVPTISINGLPEGLYMIEFVTGKSRYTHQLLVR